MPLFALIFFPPPRAQEKERLREAVREINLAYSRRGKAGPPRWPASLRVRGIEGAPGVWEMTWSFAGPDGRATFELVEIEREPAIRWRRVGGHAILSAP